MSNHIKAKFLGLTYGEIPKEEFANLLPSLIKVLRNILPRYSEQKVQSFHLNVTDDSFDTKQESLGKELQLVDAEGLWGVKIGNSGISISTNEYKAYDEVMEYLSAFLRIVEPILNISHFSQVSLRNINLFKEIGEKPNTFKDIKEGKYWGRYEIGTLTPAFLCSGAATKHVYFSKDFLSQLQLASSVVMPQQSYIPQEEWNVWKLRGEIPALPEPHLIIDIAGTAFQAPANQPAKQKNLAQYNWDTVLEEFNALHNLVNQVYTDLTKD